MRPDHKYDEPKVKTAAKAHVTLLPVVLLVVISVLVLIGAPILGVSGAI